MFIFSNLAMSLDGKISTSQRQFFPLGGKEDFRKMQVLRRNCQAILMGASTIKVYKKPCLASRVTVQPINVVLSSALEGFSPQWEFFKRKSLKRILLVGEKAPRQKLNIFAQSSEIVVLKKSTQRNPLALQMIQALEKRGVHRLLIEGGGTVMWHFVSLNLIDEYHVTLTPKIVGGKNAPTLVDGTGFTTQNIVSLRLAQCQKVKDELYLIYKKA